MAFAESKTLVLFHSVNYVMWAIKLIKKNKLQCKIASIPRELSSDCGYCIQIKQNEIDTVRAILNNANVEYDRFETLP